MRLATLIISLALSVVLATQSFAVMAASSVAGSLSEGAEKKAAEETSGGGAVGLVMALAWIVAGAFVIAKPKASLIVFGIAALLGVIGGSTGFSDLFIWAGVSALFALASWRGIVEKQNAETKRSEQYRADVVAAAQAMQTQN